jgi:hypothetical protein
VKRFAIACGLWLALAGVTLAHRAPNSVVRIDFVADRVRAEVMVPRSELGYAMAGPQDAAAFGTYLKRHLRAEAPDGARWELCLKAVREARYVDHDYLLAELELMPPRGQRPDRFVLVDDLVTHEVRNHVVWVVSRHDEALIGALQYPRSRLMIERPPAARTAAAR